MTLRFLAFLVVLLVCSPAFAADNPKTNPNQNLDRIIANERALADTMRSYSPMVETYLQRMQPDPTLGFVPSEDHYFLGRVQFQQSREEFYLDKRLVERDGWSILEAVFAEPSGLFEHDLC